MCESRVSSTNNSQSCQSRPQSSVTSGIDVRELRRFPRQALRCSPSLMAVSFIVIQERASPQSQRAHTLTVLELPPWSGLWLTGECASVRVSVRTAKKRGAGWWWQQWNPTLLSDLRPHLRGRTQVHSGCSRWLHVKEQLHLYTDLPLLKNEMTPSDNILQPV